MKIKGVRSLDRHPVECDTCCHTSASELLHNGDGTAACVIGPRSRSVVADSKCLFLSTSVYRCTPWSAARTVKHLRSSAPHCALRPHAMDSCVEFVASCWFAQLLPLQSILLSSRPRLRWRWLVGWIRSSRWRLPLRCQLLCVVPRQLGWFPVAEKK